MSALCGAFAVRRQELRQQKHHGGQQALRRIVEVGVLPVVSVAVRRHDGLGQYLGVLLRFGTGDKTAGRPCLIHVVVDEGHEIMAIRARGVTQIHHRNMIAVIFLCHRAVVAGEVTLGIQCQEAHTAGAGIFQVRVQKVRCLTHAGSADHKTMHIVLVYQRGDAVLAAGAAQHQSLRLRQIFACPPVRHSEGDEGVGLADLRIGSPPRRTMLPVAHGLGLDVVQCVVVAQQRQSADDGHHDTRRCKKHPEIICHRISPFLFSCFVLLLPCENRGGTLHEPSRCHRI